MFGRNIDLNEAVSIFLYVAQIMLALSNPRSSVRDISISQLNRFDMIQLNLRAIVW